MEKIRLGMVGCGGMGTRRIYGLNELVKTPFCNVELAALCDISRDNAELAADEAEQLLGVRPQVFTDLEEMARQVAHLDAVDVVTDPSTHHHIVCRALELGLHVMVEKPMAITVKACHEMIEAARRNDRKLSVAENFRRDPSARLVHHLLEQGVIGRPYMATNHALGGYRQIFITPWRHLKEKGGFILDEGVHYTDLIRYQLGDVAEVYGDVRLVEPVRKKRDSIVNQYEFYQQRFRAMPDRVEATAEDVSVAMFKMESGVIVNWIRGMAGHGGCSGSLILGERGVIEGFGDRGAGARMQPAGGDWMDQRELLAGVEGFALEPLAAHFFPSGSAAGDDDVDHKILALELHELGKVILEDGEPEVGGIEGMKDVAALYAIFESSRAGRAVRMSEVESGDLYAYQAEIDAALAAG